MKFHLVREADPRALDESVCGGVEAVVRQEVVVELPEDVERDASVRREHVVVGLREHGVVVVEGQVLAQELVGQLVHLR